MTQAAFYLALALLAIAPQPCSASAAEPGWGVDACLTVHVGTVPRARYLASLASAGVTVLRERQPCGAMASLKAAGNTVVAFVDLPLLRPEQEGDALPEDLLAVYRSAGGMLRQYHAQVDAWEILCEPDVGYCRDLPDRVVAFQKAVYLGIKDESRRLQLPAPIVLMGALALPPGPWLERAARNGLLGYSDAWNFHYYGRAEDFADCIRAHRTFVASWTGGKPAWPLWITECGANTIDRSADFLDPVRRRMQADFILDTARQARAENDVAVFMPFILVDGGDPYALTLQADRPLPAWNAYAAYARDHPWPRRPWAAPPADPDPVVLQWLPDNQTAVAHKVSGTYRFKDRQAIRGEVRIYNFGSKPIRGRFRSWPAAGAAATFPVTRELTLLPGSMTALSGEFSPSSRGYFQAWWSAEFESEGGAKSSLYFGLEPAPVIEDFRTAPLRLLPEPSGRVEYSMHADYRVTSAAGPWLGINGVAVEAVARNSARFCVTDLSGDPVGDPLYPPFAATRIAGLPPDGFLLLQLDRPLDRDFGLRVDLLDNLGQRFTVWENFGQSYFAKSREIWLNLRDFHIYFWGHCSKTPVFRPETVRELQLRFYAAHAGEALNVALAVARRR